MYDALIRHLAEKSRAAIKRNPGDYVQDGILYCGNCHTPKQAVLNLPSGTITPMVLCSCEQEKRKKEEAERAADERQKFAERMRSVGFENKKMRSWVFASDDGANPKLMNTARKYAENFPLMLKEGKGLLIHGATGVGKTFAAACIVNQLISQGIPCMMTSFPRLIDRLEGNFGGREEIIRDLNRYKLLCIDDLGAERDTSYMQEQVFKLIDSRYVERLPLIITTNLSPDALASPTSQERRRIYSRLYEMCIPVKAEGSDRRKEALQSGYTDFKKLLEL